MTAPTCVYCEQPYTVDSCEYFPGDERPVRFGDETGSPSTHPRCTDCGVIRGGDHHCDCTQAECVQCARQWHPGMTCAEDAALTTGGQAA